MADYQFSLWSCQGGPEGSGCIWRYINFVIENWFHLGLDSFVLFLVGLRCLLNAVCKFWVRSDSAAVFERETQGGAKLKGAKSVFSKIDWISLLVTDHYLQLP